MMETRTLVQLFVAALIAAALVAVLFAAFR